MKRVEDHGLKLGLLFWLAASWGCEANHEPSDDEISAGGAGGMTFSDGGAGGVTSSDLDCTSIDGECPEGCSRFTAARLRVDEECQERTWELVECYVPDPQYPWDICPDILYAAECWEGDDGSQYVITPDPCSMPAPRTLSRCEAFWGNDPFSESPPVCDD